MKGSFCTYRRPRLHVTLIPRDPLGGRKTLQRVLPKCFLLYPIWFNILSLDDQPLPFNVQVPVSLYCGLTNTSTLPPLTSFLVFYTISITPRHFVEHSVTFPGPEIEFLFETSLGAATKILPSLLSVHFKDQGM